MSQPAALQPGRRRWLAGLVLAGLAAIGSGSVGAQGETAAAPAAPPELADELPGARQRGAAVMRFFGLRIYEARLWSPTPLAGDPVEQPLALELVYARALAGALIARRSIEEMQGIGRFSGAQSARWLLALEALFPDVRDGDRLTGIWQPGRSARFYFNGRLRGELADAEFARLFFGIWLSPRTSEPGLRAQLLGGSP